MINLHYFDGMKLHGDNACNQLGFAKYNLGKNTEPAMFWLYCENDYKLLSRHKGQKYVFWHNQDVMGLLRMFKQYIPVARDPKIIHVCHNGVLRDELASIGIYALIRPTFWGDASKYKPTGDPLTKDCYITANAGRGAEYGEMIVNALAWALPDWQFHIFGIDPTISTYCDNVKYYGWVPEFEMDEINKNFAVCFRFNQHDGFSQTVMKALLRGQYAITSISYGNITYSYKSFDRLCDIFKYEFLTDNIKRHEIIESGYFNNFDYIK
jgi:hypothetical protein